MTDTATTRMKLRQQSQGSNTNTWGDDKLNEVLRVIDRSTKGYQALTITGDTTLSFTNYSATNDGQVSILNVTGSLSSSATLTCPSSEWVWSLIKNTTGQTLSLKTAAGTAISLPNNRQAPVYCDGTNVYFGSANIIDSDITETNSRDLTDKAYVDQAVANAAVPAATGAALVDGADTTAGFLNAKITVSGSLTKSITSPAGNEALNIDFTFDEGQTALMAGIYSL